MKSVSRLSREVKAAAERVNQIHRQVAEHPKVLVFEARMKNLVKQRDDAIEAVRKELGLEEAREKVLSLTKQRRLAQIGAVVPEIVIKKIKQITDETDTHLVPKEWSDDLQRVICQEPGVEKWAGLGRKRYNQVRWWLLDLSEVPDRRPGFHVSPSNHPAKVSIIYGRLLDEVRERWRGFLAGPEAGGVEAKELKHHG